MTGIQAAISAAGGISALARRLGLSRQAVYLWGDRIPLHHLPEIERITGVPRHVLRPDFFRDYERKRA